MNQRAMGAPSMLIVISTIRRLCTSGLRKLTMASVNTVAMNSMPPTEIHLKARMLWARPSGWPGREACAIWMAETVSVMNTMAVTMEMPSMPQVRWASTWPRATRELCTKK